MKHRPCCRLFKSPPAVREGAMLAAVALATLSLATAVGARQAAPPVKQAYAGSVPRTPDGHPDLDGFWRSPESRGKACDNDDCQEPNQPPYKPSVVAEVKVIAQAQAAGVNPLDPQVECKPLGVPRGATSDMQVIESPGLVAILYQGSPGPIFRTIYTDGRKHPKNLPLSYVGDSVGHWEGDTLIVDVTALNGETWLGGGFPGNQKYTSIHSDQEHVVERWTRKGNTLTYEATVEDPVMFSRPWVITPRQMQLAKPNEEIKEATCVPGGGKAKAKPAR
jgi:hypothetical protein